MGTIKDHTTADIDRLRGLIVTSMYVITEASGKVAEEDLVVTGSVTTAEGPDI